MSKRLPIIKITKHDRIWLKELYEQSLEGKKVTVQDMWGKLHDKLPKHYRPESMDVRLIKYRGEQIRVMGVTALLTNRRFE